MEELFESLLKKYQFGLETLMNGSDFIFDLWNYCITKGAMHRVCSSRATTPHCPTKFSPDCLPQYHKVFLVQ